MDDDRRAELLDRAYRRGSELRVRRRRWLATSACLAVIVVGGVVAVGMSHTDGPKVSVNSAVPPSTPGPPTEIVVLQAYGSRISVISAANGNVIRVLAASRGLTR